MHKSGVDSPDRFAAPYKPPPPLSTRHLVEALAAVDIQERENETGDRDDIRTVGSGLRVDEPSRRRAVVSSPLEEQRPYGEKKKKSEAHKDGRQVTGSQAHCRAKAFAFFGQVGDLSFLTLLAFTADSSLLG